MNKKAFYIVVGIVAGMFVNADGEEKQGVLIGFKRQQPEAIIALEKEKTREVLPESEINLGAVGYRVRFSSDGRFLAVGTNRGDLLVYEEGNLILKEKIPGGKLYAVGFQPRSDYLTLCRKGELVIVDLQSLKVAKKIPIKNKPLSYFTFSNKGEEIALSYLGGGVEVYKVTDGNRISSFLDLELYSFAFKQGIIFGGGRDGNIYILDTQKIETIPAHKFFILAIDVSGDGNFVASGSGDAQCFVWRYNEGNLHKEFSWIHGGWVTSLKFYKDYLITACRDGKLRVFDFKKPELLGVIKVSQKSLLSFDISSRGELAVSSSDGILRFYNFNNLVIP
jgi:WD40 repeat protein